MNERLAVLLLTTAANLLLGLSVWLKNSSRRVNQYFALFSVTIAAWTVSNGLVATYADTSWGIIWARTAFVSASVIPIIFFLFVSVFPVATPRVSRVARVFIIAVGTAAAAASLTPAIAYDATAVNGVLSMTYGSLHPFFGMYVVSGFGYSLLLLYRKQTVLTGIARLQVRYVFLAVSIPVLGGTVSNLLIPLMFHSSKFSPYGPLFSILMIGVIAHAIIRYRLMNTRLVIRRGVAYLLTTLAATAAFTAVLSLTSGVLVPQRNQLPVPIEVMLVLVIALAFQPIRRGVQALIDRYLFRQPYDYPRTIREITRTMAGILDLQPLLAYACEAIARTVRPEHIAVYTREPRGGQYRRLITHTAIPDIDPPPATEAHVSRLATSLANAEHVLVLEELETSRSTTRAAACSLIEDLNGLHAAIVLPLMENGELAGFFVIGRKLSGDPYFSEDRDLLTTLVSQATIALKNAQLYSQVVLVNEYVDNILTTMDSGVIAINPDAYVTLFNATAARLTALDAGKMACAPLHSLPAPLAELLGDTLRDKQPRTQVETTIDRPDGVSTSVLCSTSPLRDRSGSLLGVVAVFSDLTRLKTLEDQKRQAERLASIGAFASGIAHEIRNPLVAIKTFAELLPERFVEEDFRNDFARVVVTEIDRIADLVASLRGLATTSTQTLVPLDVREPLEETLTLLRGQLEQFGIIATVDFPAHVPFIAGDHAQLKQLFLNLLMNSLEAMQPGGRVEITITPRESLGTHVVTVRISDTGPGIPPALLDRIFDPFVTSKERGSGLGLPICRGIAVAHRAMIRAENNLNGKGACILMDFPVLQDTPVPSA